MPQPESTLASFRRADQNGTAGDAIYNAEQSINKGTEEEKSPHAWVKEHHPEHKEMSPKWQYVEDHYTGNLLDEGKIENYLIQRAQAEHQNEYAERKKTVTQPYHLSYLFDTFAGIIFGADRNAKHIFHDEDAPGGLGDPEDPETAAGKLWRSADGAGTDYVLFWQKFLLGLLTYHRMFVVVEGVVEDKDPHFRLVSPIAVINWRHESGRLVDVIIEHMVDARNAIQDKPEMTRRFTHYHLDGWDVYEERRTGQKVRVIAREDLSGTYEYYQNKERTTRILPVYSVELPLSRYVAYQAAKRNNSILNMESERDTALRHGNIPRLAIVGSQKFYEAVEAALKKGFKLIRHDPSNSTQHYYITPPTDSARVATEVLEQRVTDFMFTTFRDYANAAREKTATEINQDRRAGLEAFLHLAVVALTEAQTQGMKRFEQAVLPTQHGLWGSATVERDPDFQYVATATLVDQIINRTFGAGPLPVGETAMAEAIKMTLDYYGLAYDEDEVATAIADHAAKGSQEASALNQFGL